MEKKENVIDKIVYVIACICTLGSVYVVRVIISEAIRAASKNKGEE